MDYNETFAKLLTLWGAMKDNPRDLQTRLTYFEALSDARLDDVYKLMDDNKRLKSELEALLSNKANVSEGSE